jgi:hydroxymethylglutaryl-CoA reductase
MERSSRISGYYRLDRAERVEALRVRGFVTDDQAALLLRAQGQALPFAVADKMIENVVGLFELPIGLGLNFKVNGKDYVVPMVVEEPSIVAAVSHTAALVRQAGGFEAEADRSVMTGQIQVIGAPDPEGAVRRILARKDDLLALADQLEPGMRQRGGGAVDLDVRWVRPDDERSSGHSRHQMVVVHVYFDTCDAMGANLINTVCEGMADDIEELTGGRVFLRILSNLADRRRVKARCRLPVADLAWQGFVGEEVAEGIVRASEFAEVDPYRAATHNKGIMNGIDAVAIATGQDWRAIEAGAHAFAALDGQYRPMARWWREQGELVGEIDIPMAVGIVGGPIRLHPMVKTLLALLGVESAAELGCVMAAVGLAQNLAAIKALGTTGIQKGHMALHARSVAATAGATGDLVEEVAQQLMREGVIKVERARELLQLRGVAPA